MPLTRCTLQLDDKTDESVNRSQYLRELVALTAEASSSTFLFYTKCTT